MVAGWLDGWIVEEYQLCSQTNPSLNPFELSGSKARWSCEVYSTFVLAYSLI